MRHAQWPDGSIAAEKWALRQGCSEFGSDSDIDNDVSQAAHLRSAFEETGRVRTDRKKIIEKDQSDTLGCGSSSRRATISSVGREEIADD